MSDNIKSCSCKNEFQDDKYGNGMRLMNKTTSGYRCTVCGSTSGSTVAGKKK